MEKRTKSRLKKLNLFLIFIVITRQIPNISYTCTYVVVHMVLYNKHLYFLGLKAGIYVYSGQNLKNGRILKGLIGKRNKSKKGE